MLQINKKLESLLTKKEFQLALQSKKEKITTLSASTLKKNIKLTRTLRDKFRDLSKRQRITTKKRNTTNRTESANKRTGEKAKVFSELLARYEMQLKKITSPRRPLTTRTATKKKTTQTKKVKAPRFLLQDQKSLSRKAKGPKANHSARTRSILGHVRSAGKRNQARRDRRSR